MKKLILMLPVSIALFAALAASTGKAQYYEAPDLRIRGYRDHTGLFSHISLGLGYSSTEGEIGSLDLGIKGVSYKYHFALGGSVMPGLAIHFSAFGFDVFSPGLEVNGKLDKDIDAGASVIGLGAGVTYYLPMNLYLSASGGLGLANVTDTDGDGFGLDPGYALRGGVGYEWWVGAAWGVGLSIEAMYFAAKEETNAGSNAWSGFAIAPMFSATMN